MSSANNQHGVLRGGSQGRRKSIHNGVGVNHTLRVAPYSSMSSFKKSIVFNHLQKANPFRGYSGVR